MSKNGGIRVKGLSQSAICSSTDKVDEAKTAVVPSVRYSPHEECEQRGRAITGWVAASPEQLANVRRTREVWNQGDFETWIEGFAPDCEWYPSTVGAVEGGSTAIHGHEGLRAYTRQAEEVWELFHVEFDDALRRGNLALLLGRVRTRGRVSGVETETPMFWLFDQNEHDRTVWGKSFLDLDEALAAATEREATSGSV